MAKFGAFQVNRACGHVFGHTDMQLVPGRYEPASLEEFEAMDHLATVPAPSEKSPDGELVPGEPFAVKLEEPEGEQGPRGVVEGVVADEPLLPEPPVAGGSEPADGSPAVATPAESEE